MKYTIKTAHWRVPSEERAFDGCLEGSPTPAERTAILAEVAGRRENWTPNSEAWSQLRDVEHFIGRRVRIQFWDPIMFLLEDEGPYPVLADCQGIVLLRRERFLQAYLILDRVEELPNSSGYSPASFLERDSKLGCTLAPIAEVLEIEDGGTSSCAQRKRPRDWRPSMLASEREVKTMTSAVQSPLLACRNALIKAFRKSAPGISLDEKGYVLSVEENLIEGVSRRDFEADLRQGDGNELKKKFLAVHSSSALAVNAFAPFKANPHALQLLGQGGFPPLIFERKCPHGIPGRRPPNLDVLTEDLARIVAIESKCLEHLSPHVAKFAPAYESEIKDERCKSAWFREMQRLRKSPRTYRWLDVAQLIKHAFGLAYTFPNRSVTLLYLYWEPSNADVFPMFGEHRREIARFAEAIAGDGPKFVSMSYPELWQGWQAVTEPEWLKIHVSRLRTRYAVAA